MATIVVLAILVAVGYHALSPDERARVRQALVIVATRIGGSARHELATLCDAVGQRPIAFGTPALVAINVGVFLCMLFGRGSLSDAQTLIAWGASYGPRTSNGEWWRLATAPFVHGGILTLAVNAIALVEVGVVIERRVGWFVLWTAYASAALLANVVNLWIHPLVVTSGASGGVCGVYGLLLASVAAAFGQESERATSIAAVRRLMPMTAVVVIFNIADAGVGTIAEIAGVVTGFVLGAVALSGGRTGVARRRTGLALAGAIGIAVVAVAVLGKIIDVRPEIQRLLELEQHTAKTYELSYGTFKKNRMDIEALARVIEQTIVPALQQADDRVKSLRGVPHDETWRLSDGREYLRLRVESWSLRARGLRETSAPVRSTSSAEAAARYRSSLQTLGQADAAERSALKVLDRIKI